MIARVNECDEPHLLPGYRDGAIDALSWCLNDDNEALSLLIDTKPR